MSSSDDESVYSLQSFPLHDAAESGNVELLEKLLKEEEEDNDFTPGEGSNGMNERDDDGCTPLHLALFNAHTECTRALLAAGARAGLKCEGLPVLHIALSLGALEQHRDFCLSATKLLVENDQVDVESKDDRGRSVLHVAAEAGLTECARVLIDHGASECLNVRAKNGWRPLHVAARFDHVDTVSLYLDSGAQIGGKSLFGESALHIAAAYGSHRAVRLLIDRGADVSSVDKFGRTAVDCAQQADERWSKSLCRMLEDTSSAIKATMSSCDGVEKAMDAGTTKAEKPTTVSSDTRMGDSMVWQKAAGEARETGSESKDEGGDRASESARTLLITHPKCLDHIGQSRGSRGGREPPPENPMRLIGLLDERRGALRAAEFRSDKVEWDWESPQVQLADVLAVHDFAYVERLRETCKAAENAPTGVELLDQDTALSKESMEAAMFAAGAVTEAVERVCSGRNKNAFCAVRPPGHHAGPRGIVTSEHDPHGSHGFCLLNNVAIGAAYARRMFRRKGIRRIAIVDFDVHHGNGTEEIVKQVLPREENFSFVTPLCKGVMKKVECKPWLNQDDADEIFFATIQGYGQKDEVGIRAEQQGWFYPGSGKTESLALRHVEVGNKGLNDDAHKGALTNTDDEAKPNESTQKDRGGQSGMAKPNECSEKDRAAPNFINVGLPIIREPIPNLSSRNQWREGVRRNILPSLLQFRPDLILISAGFDAHRRDTLNCGFVGTVEEDYEWITEHLMAIANTCCDGRIVSVLEGGYKVKPGLGASPFARSVAAHVRALCSGSRALYSAKCLEVERAVEVEIEDLACKRKQQKILAAQERERWILEQAAPKRELSQETTGSTTASTRATAEKVEIDTLCKNGDENLSTAADPMSISAQSDIQGKKRLEHPEADPSEANSGRGQRRRRGAPVDYVALAKKLEAERAGNSG